MPTKTQKKSQRKDVQCKTKSNFTGARVKDRQGVGSNRSTRPRQLGQQRQSVQNGKIIRQRIEQDRTKQDVRVSQTTRPGEQGRPIQDVRVSQLTPPRTQDRPKQDVRVGQKTSARVQDRPKQDVRVSQFTRPRVPGRPIQDVRVSQITRQSVQNRTKQDVRVSQITPPRIQDRPKQDVRVGQKTSARVQDRPKQDVRVGQIKTSRVQDRPKQDVRVGQITKPRDHNRPERHVSSSQGKGSRVQNPSSVTIPPKTPMSRSQHEPKQPKHNTRFLHDLQSSGNSLKRLHDEKVKQDPDKTKRCNEIVDHLVKFMQHNVKYKVSEVVKGGSLGKGTSIKDKVDIDLVVFVKDLKSVADLQERREEVIKDFKKHILKDFTFAKQVHYNYDTKHSNRFGIRIDDSKDLIQVDLLPACDIGGGSKSTFREMARIDEEARSFYSVSFAKDQKRFTKEKPEPVKEAIRLVKDWKTREKLNIPSYTAEIVTSKEWERMGRPDKPDLDQLFKRSVGQFSDMDNLNVAWSNSRKTGDSGPVVMDPANPFNNTASMIERSDQKVIERKAREIVSRLD